jgi:hypothetical protein
MHGGDSDGTVQTGRLNQVKFAFMVLDSQGFAQ